MEYPIRPSVEIYRDVVVRISIIMIIDDGR